MKAFYHLNVAMICGSCGATMHNDLDLQPPFDEHGGKDLGGWYRVVYCDYEGTPNCAQKGVRLRINPLEVEVVENQNEQTN